MKKFKLNAVQLKIDSFEIGQSEVKSGTTVGIPETERPTCYVNMCDPSGPMDTDCNCTYNQIC